MRVPHEAVTEAWGRKCPPEQPRGPRGDAHAHVAGGRTEQGEKGARKGEPEMGVEYARPRLHRETYGAHPFTLPSQLGSQAPLPPTETDGLGSGPDPQVGQPLPGSQLGFPLKN